MVHTAVGCGVLWVGLFVGGIFSFCWLVGFCFVVVGTDQLTLPWTLSIFSWELGKQLLIYYRQDIEK